MKKDFPELPSYFDGQLSPKGLGEEDLQLLRSFGLRAALLGVSSVHLHPAQGSFTETLDDLMEVQLPRLRALGILVWAQVGIPPLAIPRRGLEQVLSALPLYFQGGQAKALGPLGLHHGGGIEEAALVAQLKVAKRLRVPVIISTPARSKEKLTKRILMLVEQSGVAPKRVWVNHANERTVKLILSSGHYAGLTLHPDALSTERAHDILSQLGSERLILNSNLGPSAGDLLGIPRLLSRWAHAHLPEDVIQEASWNNLARFLKVTPKGWHSKTH